jgi:hypothetical protein
VGVGACVCCLRKKCGTLYVKCGTLYVFGVGGVGGGPSRVPRASWAHHACACAVKAPICGACVCVCLDHVVVRGHMPLPHMLTTGPSHCPLPVLCTPPPVPSRTRTHGRAQTIRPTACPPAGPTSLWWCGWSGATTAAPPPCTWQTCPARRTHRMAPPTTRPRTAPRCRPT